MGKKRFVHLNAGILSDGGVTLGQFLGEPSLNAPSQRGFRFPADESFGSAGELIKMGDCFRNSLCLLSRHPIFQTKIEISTYVMSSTQVGARPTSQMRIKIRSVCRSDEPCITLRMSMDDG
jgi:hypothetical protein